MNCPASRARRWPPRRGYTLLEILLALAMLATLLACLWSLFGAFTRLFATGPEKVDEAQLVTAFARQLAADLRNALEDSPPPPEAGTVGLPTQRSSVRRFGLVGSGAWLRFDVLQSLPQNQQPRDPDSGTGGPRDDAGPRVPELRTIVYEFTPPVEDTAETAAEEGTLPTPAAEAAGAAVVRPGLVRYEADFETPSAESGQALLDRVAAGERQPTPSAAPGMPGGPPTLRPPKDAVAWFPEIASLSFRYFDGQSWSGAWNSLDRKSLPVAVEVTVQTRAAPRDTFVPPAIEPTADAANASADTTAGATIGATADTARADATVDEAAGPSSPAAHRFVLHLPAARLRSTVWKPVEAASRLDRPPPLVPPPPPAVVSPRVPPPMPPPRGPAPLVRPDQWMRIGS